MAADVHYTFQPGDFPLCDGEWGGGGGGGARRETACCAVGRRRRGEGDVRAFEDLAHARGLGGPVVVVVLDDAEAVYPEVGDS